MTETHGPPSNNRQGWGGWFLDLYANSTIQTHDELSESDGSMSPIVHNSDSMVSTDHSYSPYVKTGRGGAGNFTWQSAQHCDIEMGQVQSLKEKRKVALRMENIDTSAAVRNFSWQGPQYIKTGRGGAGNMPYVQGNTPQPSPTARDFRVSTPRSASSPTMIPGRGGAGNYGAANSMQKQARLAKETEEQEESLRQQELAKAQVESILKAPTSAHISSSRRKSITSAETEKLWA